MKNGMLIIDADGHVGDFDAAYRQRLPEEFKRRQSIGGGGDGFDRRQNGAIPWRATSVEQNLADNDLEGIDVQVLFPTGGLGLTKLREHDYSIAFAQAFNDFARDYCAANPSRLKAVCITPLHVDVQAAIREVERATQQLGLVGVMVNTYMRDKNVGHRDLWPFYEACAGLGVAVAFHAAGQDAMGSVSHFDTLLGMHTFSHAPEQLLACTAVIYAGLLEQFPTLRVGFMEAGAGWVPFWMEHMDEEWEKRRFDAPNCKRPPSHYMKNGRVFVSCEPEERTLTYVAQWIGDGQILFPSDYPHWDSIFPHAVEELMTRKDVSDDLKRKVFSENAQRFYGFTVNPADFTEATTVAAGH